MGDRLANEIQRCKMSFYDDNPAPGAENQIQFDDSLHQQKLEQVQSARYLGIVTPDHLDWGQHSSEISSQATKTMCFLQRNLALVHRHTKEAAYKTLVRPQLEYAELFDIPIIKLGFNLRGLTNGFLYLWLAVLVF